MSTAKLTLRPPPNVDFVHGYPGIPPGGPERPQAAVKGAIEVRIGPQGVKAKWLRVELRKVETLPGEGGPLNVFYDYVGPSPVNLWTSPDEYGVLRNQDFPFSIRIPESIPPSIALDNKAGIQYELVASLCTKGKRNLFRKRKSNVVSTSAAIIIDKHDLHSTWPVYTQPETRQIQAEGGTLTVDRSQTCFGPGDRIQVVANFRSDTITGPVLRGFELSLRETTIFTTGAGGTGKKSSPQVKVTQIGDHKLSINGQLYPGAQHRAELAVNLSPNHTTATLNTARHIDVTYALTVKAHVDGLPHIAMDLPVIISNWQRSVSQIAVKRIGPTPGLSLTPVAAVPQSVIRSESAAPPPGAATIGFGADATKLANNIQYNTAPVSGAGGYSDAKADEFGGYGGGFAKSKHAHNPSVDSYGGGVGTGVGTGARRPGSAGGAGGASRFTIMNAEPHELASPDPPRAQLQNSTAPTATTPSGQLAQAYLTAEQEKKLYADARSRVERTQGVAKVITPPPTPPPAQTTTPPPQRNLEKNWPSAEVEKQQLRRFHEAQAAVQRTQQGLGSEETEDVGGSDLGRVSSISKPPIAGGSSAAGGNAPATGAALYTQAIAQRDQALSRQQSAGNIPQGIPTVPHYLTAEQEKAALKRYEQAKQAVDRVQGNEYEDDAGPLQSGSGPIAYESLYPNQPAPAPAPAAAPPPADLPPPFEPAAVQPANSALAEKERLKRAYEAQDAAAAAAARQGTMQQREPSPPPIAPTGATQIKQALTEKEILRRKFEAEDARRAAAQATQNPTPAPTPQAQSQQPRSLPAAAGGARSPRPTPAPPTSPGRILTAAEEKALLKAQYAAQDRARSPPAAPQQQPSYAGSTGSQPSSPGPGSSMQYTTSPTQISGPPAPPPLAPRPPIHYIRETQEPNEATMGAFVAAGPSNSVVIDKQGMYWMTGKWKNSGEGSSGSPYSTFRFMQDIMTCKMSRATCGGVTHWALTPDDDNVGINMTVGWGQNAANGELGLGEDQPKSATKPIKHVPLTGIDVFDIAAGQNTTLFLARPSDKMSDLPRHPEDVQPPLLCVKCDTEKGEDDSPLECDKCDAPWHLGCLDPPLSSVPDGEWFCVSCSREPGAPIGTYPLRKARPRGKGPAKKSSAASKAAAAEKKEKEEKKKREREPSPMDEDEDEDEEDEDSEEEEKKRGKRKASKRGRGGATKKSRR